MTTKILTGAYASGYTLQAPVTLLSIASTGYVEGSGVATAVTATNAYAVVNDGRIAAANSAGVAGVYLAAGGSVTNGSAGDHAAVISGYRGVKIEGAAGTVANFGSIAGETRSGVWLNGGGLVTNGSAADTTASITGGVAGVSIDIKGTVVNFGTIDPGVQFVALASGKVTNGSATDTTALIAGTGSGVYFYQGKGNVQNYGAIEGGDKAHSAGVFLGGAKSRLTNGNAADVTASVSGYDGVYLRAGGAVANFGAIVGQGDGPDAAGVYLALSGKVVNGSAGDLTASITGYDGVVGRYGGTVINYGTVTGTGGLQQIAAQRDAPAGAPPRGAAVYIHQSGAIVNGSAADGSALLSGYTGVVGRYSVTVTNFGTIAGSSGVALQFLNASDTLVAEAGCVFQGAVEGGGATLDLGSGTGTISGLGSGTVTVSGSMATTVFADFVSVEVGAGATFTTVHPVSIVAGAHVDSLGSLSLGTAMTTVTNAGALIAGTGGQLTVKGALSNAANASVTSNGNLLLGTAATTVTNAGALIAGTGGQLMVKGALINTGAMDANGGTLTVEGAVTGAGGGNVSGGTLDLRSTFTENVGFGKSGTLELAQSQAYTGTVFGFSTKGTTTLDLDDIAFVSATEATLSGNVLTVTDGAHTAHFILSGDFSRTAFIAARDGHGGVLVTAQKTGEAAPPATTAFVHAAAGLAASPGPATHLAGDRPDRAPLLTRPHCMQA